MTGICPRLAGDAASLEDLRAAVLEERLACDLMLGRHADVAAEGPALVSQFPLRERLAGQVMELYEGLHHPAAEQMRARLDQVPGSSGPLAV